jgi:hypothetical protein
MGLLDDAIREHLELKRRSGADPGEIALQERAALDPVYRSEDAAAEGLESLEQAPEAAPTGPLEAGDPDVAELLRREDAVAAGPEAPEAVPGAEAAIPADDTPPHGDPLAGSQAPLSEETAEIDMGAVLAAEDDYDGPQGDELGAAALGTQAEESRWDFPTGQPEEPPPDPIPGQERLSFE